jgi:hypothetical protein
MHPFDQNLLFADNQNLAAAAGNVLLATSHDTRVAGTPVIGGPLIRNFGAANPMDITFVVTEAFTSGGAATLQWQIIQADDGALTTNLEVLRQTGAEGFALFTLGSWFHLGKVPSMDRRFLGVRLVIGTAATTAGKVTGGLTAGFPSHSTKLLAIAV